MKTQMGIVYLLIPVFAALLLLSVCAKANAQESLCRSLNDAARAVKNATRGKPASFSVVCDVATAGQLNANGNGKLNHLLHCSGVERFGNARYVQQGDSVTYHFSSVAYYRNYDLCASPKDFGQAVARFKAAGTDDFVLVCANDVFREMQDLNNGDLWARLYGLGICSASVSYGNNLFRFEKVTYLEAQFVCRSVKETERAFSYCSRKLLSRFALVCSPDVYRRLCEDEGSALHGLMSFFGIYQTDSFRDDNAHAVVFRNAVYYPGFRLCRFFEAGKTREMSREEERLFLKAGEIVGKITGERSLLMREKFLHDWLGEHVAYFKHETNGYNVYDTAIGAILHGRADCDGYADAFCLLCQLAGIPAGMMSGRAIDGVSEPGCGSGDTGHAWNLISLDRGSNWYMVDVTWDAAHEGGPVGYCCFNTGRDEAMQSRTWNPNAEPVHWARGEDKNISYYGGAFEGRSFASPADAAAYLIKQLKGRSGSLDVRLNGEYTASSVAEAVSAAVRKNGLNGSYRYGCRNFRTFCGKTYATLSVEFTA